MSPALTYLPAYVGLYSALVLAMACNSFLDIQYGTFGIEVLFWAGIFGFTLYQGWRQRGMVNEAGRQWQKAALVLGGFLSFVVFIPMWGFPRAGLAMLGMLQATMNCTTTTRRSLHLGLLVAVVMVVFASSHYRADWTMLFYLVPFLVAVVFTLVAEQISRRAQDLSRDSLGTTTVGGQGAAIVSATATILLIGGLLYAATPQVTWPYLFWKFGQAGVVGTLDDRPGQGQPGSGKGLSGSGQGQSGARPGEKAGDQGVNGESPSADGDDFQPSSGWPTAQEMRDAARRAGMPRWQSSAIERLADFTELTRLTLTPIRLGLDELWNDVKERLDRHRSSIAQSLLAVLAIALLVAAWQLLREARPGVWLATRIDFFRFGLFRWHASGHAGVFQYYRAMETLLDLHGVRRPASINAREYLGEVCSRYRSVKREATELTLIFERARYGNAPVTNEDVASMRRCYQAIYVAIVRSEQGSLAAPHQG